MKIGMPSDLNYEKYPNHEQLPICGVVATSVASGVPFTTVYNWYKSQHRGNWKGALAEFEIMQGMKHFGAELKKAKVPSGVKTLADFIALHAINNPDVVYVVNTTSHIQVVKGRHVVDQAGYKDIINYRWKRKVVEGVYQLLSRNVNFKAIDTVIPQAAPKPIRVTGKRKTDAVTIIKFIADRIINNVHRDLIVDDLINKYGYKQATAMIYYYKVKKEMK